MSLSSDPRLRAEARAVEEGHHARLVGDWGWKVEYLVKAESEDGSYTVVATDLGSWWRFDCGCKAGRNRRLCKHSQLVARRLEREGRAVLQGMTWCSPAPNTDTFAPEVLADPFVGLI